jgi:radical SAM protein with 4Fe4S-binding SPASM domain
MSESSYDNLYADVSARFRQAAVPLSVELEVTRRCHLDCIHCYVDHNACDDELSFDEITELLDELADLGVLQLSVTGGEPFVRRDIWEILEAVRRRGFLLRLFTTATMIGDQAAQRLKALALAEAHISLYAPTPALHDAITTRPGSFEKSLAGMRRLAAQGITVWLKSVVLRQNKDSILDLVALAEREGFRYQFDTNITPADTPERLPLDYRMNQEELNAFLSDERIAQALFKNNGLKAMCEALVNTDTSGSLCDIGGATARIDASGNVQPCALYPAVDNIRHTRFSSIWRANPDIKRLRELTYETQQHCGDCAHVASCSPCPAFATLENGHATSCNSGSRMHAIAFAKLAKKILSDIDTP